MFVITYKQAEIEYSISRNEKFSKPIDYLELSVPNLDGL